MKIWAHRGCSQMFPENTMTAFNKAIEIPGLTGIELDIQMTKDGEIVVIHDERVDRTTDGLGYVKDFTYSQLKELVIKTGYDWKEKIPTIDEVLDLMQDRMKEGLLLNIELKNSVVFYEGMEEKIVALIHKKGLEKYVVYSSFYTKSLDRIRRLEPEAFIGVLDVRVSDCFYKKRGAFGADDKRAALHPFQREMDITKAQLQNQTVRAWFTGHLYPDKPTGRQLDFDKLEQKGITDVFLNEPEVYLGM